ncbi:MAG: hypothetical protein C5B53_12620 [Candidatus Melainabacteria bacterium]|nr:MAG: hypothetical protein C5B53_12620 [Candidatus Melainabacteria bacterium]
MKKWHSAFLCLALVLAQVGTPARPQSSSGNAQPKNEAGANTLAFPKQILKSGVSLTSTNLSPNTRQLAETIGLTSVLERIQSLRAQLANNNGPPTLETLNVRQELWEQNQKALLIIQRTNLDIDFALAEIYAEVQVYEEILATFQSDRDKLVARVNAASFISNGILWALAEGYDIPTFKYARLSIQSGTLGVAAGLVPSFASMYTLKAVNGKKKTSETDPNMLAKLFGYPATKEIDYPRSVWEFIHQVPADDPVHKTRLDQMVDRWIADANMPAFTSRTSSKQLDVITASVAQKKGLSIATLTAREVMLNQLSAEIMKMKRLLLELTMALEGEKQITANQPEVEQRLPPVGMQGVP